MQPFVLSFCAIRSHGTIETPTKHDMDMASVASTLFRAGNHNFVKMLFPQKSPSMQLFINSECPPLEAALILSVSYLTSIVSTPQWPRSITRIRALSYLLPDPPLHLQP
jgi:hypothetical protein